MASVVNHARARQVDPIFVVTLARSGSTLLRYLLDSHSAVTCPPELNISQLLSEHVRPWLGMHDDKTQSERESLAILNAKRAATSLMSWHVAQTGKRRFCDKSLSTVDQIDIVWQVFPRAQYVLLYRHCLDLVVSGLDASRWGFSAFGFLPYIQSSVPNFVSALVQYWCDKTERALDFERRRPESCYRVYYEMLVKEPAETLKGVLEYLNLEWEEEILAGAFQQTHQKGPADYEVEYTEEVADRSLGRGSTIPVGLIPLQQRVRMNAILRQLGYPTVDDRWNDRPSPLLSLAAPVQGDTRTSTTQLMEDIARPRVKRLARELRPEQLISIRMIIEESPNYESWVLDLARGEVHPGYAATTLEMVLSSGVLEEVALQRWSPGEAINSGRLRVTRSADGAEPSSQEATTLLRMLFGPEGNGVRKDLGLAKELTHSPIA